MHINEFDFHLPEYLIAQSPPKQRGDSRLLVSSQDGLLDKKFSDFSNYLSAGDVLVINNTKVIKARMFGQKITGGKIEVLIERVLDQHQAMAHIRASKSPKIGTRIKLDDDIFAECTGREDDLFRLRFETSQSVFEILENNGHIPLPPYITRKDNQNDSQRYQTVYGKEQGAVAAPTAGLHFTNEILEQLKNKGVQIVEITLHVGAGTFQPVRVENIYEHKMHKERYIISDTAVDTINQAKEQGKKICAVGTTSLRAIESASISGKLIAGNGDTDIFITPGFNFQTIDMLLTNFHLPKSTLLMLVSAFSGLEQIKQIYQHAISHEYRFFSYGDAMLLYKRQNNLSGNLKVNHL